MRASAVVVCLREHVAHLAERLIELVEPATLTQRSESPPDSPRVRRRLPHRTRSVLTGPILTRSDLSGMYPAFSLDSGEAKQLRTGWRGAARSKTRVLVRAARREVGGVQVCGVDAGGEREVVEFE